MVFQISWADILTAIGVIAPFFSFVLGRWLGRKKVDLIIICLSIVEKALREKGYVQTADVISEIIWYLQRGLMEDTDALTEDITRLIEGK